MYNRENFMQLYVVEYFITNKNKLTNSNVQLKLWRTFINVNKKKFKRIDATKIQGEYAHD